MQQRSLFAATPTLANRVRTFRAQLSCSAILALALLAASPASADWRRPGPMIVPSANIVYDSQAEGTGTTSLSWTHTPVGTLRGVIQFCINNTVTTDVFSGATYGGTAMTRITSTSVNPTGTADDFFVEAYFLGASIPTGPQTAACTVASGAEAKHGVSFGVTAAGDLQTAGNDFCTVSNISIDDPACTISAIPGASWAAAGMGSGKSNESATEAGSAFTLGPSHDFGNASSASERRTTELPSGDQVCAFNYPGGVDPSAMICVAVEDVP